MQITFRQLKVFLKVAECLSYTKAADKLFMSQPAVSKQVKQLEEMVGHRLFEKVGRRIFLTDAGYELQKYADSIINLVAEAKEHLAHMGGGEKGCLKVAAATTASSFAIDMLGQFRRSYPEVEFEFKVTNRETLIKKLEDNLVDLVIMGAPPENSLFNAEPFMPNPLVFIAPTDHPLIGKKVSLNALSKETIIAREEGSGTRQALEKFFQDGNKEIEVGTIFNSNDSIKRAVMSGFGLALVSIHTIQVELENSSLAVLDVKGAPIQKNWHLVHHKDKELSAVAEIFRNFILEKTA